MSKPVGIIQPNIFILFNGGDRGYGRVGQSPVKPNTITTITMTRPPGWRCPEIERPFQGEVLGLDAASGVVFRDGVPIGKVWKDSALNRLRESIGLPPIAKPQKSKTRKRKNPHTGNLEKPDDWIAKTTARGPTLGWASHPRKAGENHRKVEKVR